LAICVKLINGNIPDVTVMHWSSYGICAICIAHVGFKSSFYLHHLWCNVFVIWTISDSHCA
jgi:hypothetical protein